MKTKFFVVLVAAVLSGPSGALAQVGWGNPPRDGEWSDRPGSPEPIGAGATFLATDQADTFYVFPGGGSSSVYTLNVAAWTWSSFTTLPDVLKAGGNAVFRRTDKSLWSTLGGGGVVFLKFDPATLQWRRKRDLPSPASQSRLIATTSRLYFTTGNLLYEYSEVSDQWTARRTPPGGDGLVPALEWPGVGDLLYGTGFQADVLHDRSFFRYDCSTDSWVDLTVGTGLPADESTTDLLFRARDGYLWYLNFFLEPRSKKMLATLYEFNAARPGWTRLCDAVPGITDPGGVGVACHLTDDVTYVSRGSGTIDVMRYSASGRTFLTALASPPNRIGVAGSSVAAGSDVFVIPGDGGSAFLKYSTTTSSWSPSLATLPAGTTRHSCLVHDGADSLYAALDGSGFARYSISGNAWTALSIHVAPARGLAALAWSDRASAVYSISDAGLACFDPVSETWIPKSSSPHGFGANPLLVCPPDSGKLLAMTGVGAEFLEYDVATDQWNPVALPNLPVNPGAGATASFSRGPAFLYYLPAGGLTDLQVCDLVARHWTPWAAPAPGTILAGASFTCADGFGYLIRGGMTQDIVRFGIPDGAPTPQGLRAADVLQLDGTTPLGMGGLTVESGVVLKMIAEDPELDRIHLEVEVKLLPGSFDGQGLIAGGPAPSDSPISVPVTGLRPGTYQARVRLIDSLGQGSAFVPLGDAQGVAFVVRSNAAPVAAALRQYRAGGDPIADGEVLADGERDIRVEVDGSDPDGDALGVEVEFIPLDNPSASIHLVAAPGAAGTVAFPVTLEFGRYWWRARATDRFQLTGAWTDRGSAASAAFQIFTFGGSSGAASCLGSSSGHPGPWLLAAAAFARLLRRRRA